MTHWLFKALTVSFMIGISVQLCQRHSASETEKEERLLPADDVSRCSDSQGPAIIPDAS